MGSRFGNAARMVVAATACACAAPSLAAQPSKIDACKTKWEQRLGPLAEARPSRLAGFREWRAADGNSFYVDKACVRAFVGAVVEWSQAESLKGVERVDRSTLDYASMASVGPAKPGESWIFVLPPDQLGALAQALRERPALERQGFYVVVLSGADVPCRTAKMDVDQWTKGCSASPALAWALAGRSGAFAVDRGGARLPVSSWGDFFTRLGKKNGSR